MIQTQKKHSVVWFHNLELKETTIRKFLFLFRRASSWYKIKNNSNEYIISLEDCEGDFNKYSI